jgi:hypothetical protein
VCALCAGKATGDTLLSAVFVSYLGGFDSIFRRVLVEQHWQPALQVSHCPYARGGCRVEAPHTSFVLFRPPSSSTNEPSSSTVRYVFAI